jgi:hypothetical protein
MLLLLAYMSRNLGKTYLISQLGSGLANKYGIWEGVIKNGIAFLKDISNVIFLWEEDEGN